jgi:hypothetical protein
MTVIPWVVGSALALLTFTSAAHAAETLIKAIRLAGPAIGAFEEATTATVQGGTVSTYLHDVDISQAPWIPAHLCDQQLW